MLQILPIAYLDPGTGAIFLQVIAASLITATVYFRAILLAPLQLLFGKKNKQ